MVSFEAVEDPLIADFGLVGFDALIGVIKLGELVPVGEALAVVGLDGDVGLIQVDGEDLGVLSGGQDDASGGVGIDGITATAQQDSAREQCGQE